MPLVFVRDDSSQRVFHASEDCYRGLGTHPMQQVELDDLKYTIPCTNCYPDAPRAQYKRLICHKCQQKRPYPCRHNGGVPVFMNRSSRRGRIFSVRMYVWPEMVRFHM